MKIQELLNASGFIIRNNVTEHVVAAEVIWDTQLYKLTIIYYIDRPLVESEEEQELGELALTELLSEFPDVKSADTQYHWVCDGKPINESENLVYKRMI